MSEEEVAANKAIEIEMKNAKKKLDSEIKLLLLGKRNITSKIDSSQK